MRRKFEINLLFTFNDSVFVPPTKLYRIIKYVALPCRAPFSLICSGFLNFPCSPLKLRSSSSNTLKTKSHWSKSEVSCRILDFIKHGQDKEALKLMKTAEHCGVKFSKQVYHDLLHLYRKRKDAEGANSVWKLIPRSSLNTALYNSLISVFIAAGAHRSVYNVFLEFHNVNRPNGATFQLLLDSAKTEEEIDDCLKKMFACQFSFKHSTWLGLCAAYLRVANVVSAFELLHECPYDSLHVSLLMRLLLGSALDARRAEAAISAWRALSQRQVAPGKWASGALLVILARRQRKATVALQARLADSYQTNADNSLQNARYDYVTSRIIYSGFSENNPLKSPTTVGWSLGRLSELVGRSPDVPSQTHIPGSGYDVGSAWRSLLVAGVVPGPKLFHALFWALGHIQAFHSILATLHAIHLADLPLSRRTLHKAMHAFAQSRGMVPVVSFIAIHLTTFGAECPPNEATYCAVIRSVYAVEELPILVIALRKMMQSEIQPTERTFYSLLKMCERCLKSFDRAISTSSELFTSSKKALQIALLCLRKELKKVDNGALESLSELASLLGLQLSEGENPI